MVPEVNTQRQEGKYPTPSVNSVLIFYSTGNTQSVILLSSIALPPYLHVGFNLYTR